LAVYPCAFSTAAAAGAPSAWPSCSVNDGSGAERVAVEEVLDGDGVVLGRLLVEVVRVGALAVLVVAAAVVFSTVTVLVFEPQPARASGASASASRRRGSR